MLMKTPQVKHKPIKDLEKIAAEYKARGWKTEPAVRPRPVRRHVFSTVAKVRHLPQFERAEMAARYLKGEMTPKPNWDLAKHIFRVHCGQISDAMRELDNAGTTAEPMIEAAWFETSQEARAAFVQKHLNELWHLVDAATAA